MLPLPIKLAAGPRRHDAYLALCQKRAVTVSAGSVHYYGIAELYDSISMQLHRPHSIEIRPLRNRFVRILCDRGTRIERQSELSETWALGENRT